MSITLQFGVHPTFGGALITKSEYSEAFVRLAKERIHWQNRVWWKADKTWMFNPSCVTVVWDICMSVFGERGIRVNNRLFPQYECPEFLKTNDVTDLPPWLGGNVTAAVKAYHESKEKDVDEKVVPKCRLIDL